MQPRSVTSTERAPQRAVAVDRSFLSSMGGIGLLMIWAACFGVAFAARF